MRDEESFSSLILHLSSGCLLQNFDNLFGERVDHAVMDFNAVPLAFNDPLVFQQRQMLGNGCLGKSEALPNVFYIALLGA